MLKEEKAIQICARLITNRVVHKKEIKEMFHDESLRAAVEEKLAVTGFEPVTHIYSDYVSVRVTKDLESTVFDDGKGGYKATNFGLQKGAITLLVIIWAKIVLPKRQMQIERKPAEGEQVGLFYERNPIPKGGMMKLEEKTLLADFGGKVGGKTKLRQYVGDLVRYGFIHRREGIISEGPLLDTIIDYSVLAPRIIEGCMAGIFEEIPSLIEENEAGEEERDV